MGLPKKKIMTRIMSSKKRKRKEKIVSHMQSLFAHVISERERESCEAKKEKEKKFVTHAHVPTCTGDLTERERDPYPREITHFSLKMPPSRDTAPYFIKRRASNMHSLVSYT